MRVTWHPEAELEFLDAAKFLEDRVPGLGADFLDSVDATVSHIKKNPTSFPFVDETVQRCRVNRFPHCVYFRITEDCIRILVVKHHGRHPDYWKGRQ